MISRNFGTCVFLWKFLFPKNPFTRVFQLFALYFSVVNLVATLHNWCGTELGPTPTILSVHSREAPLPKVVSNNEYGHAVGSEQWASCRVRCA